MLTPLFWSFENQIRWWKQDGSTVTTWLKSSRRVARRMLTTLVCQLIQKPYFYPLKQHPLHIWRLSDARKSWKVVERLSAIAFNLLYVRNHIICAIMCKYLDIFWIIGSSSVIPKVTNQVPLKVGQPLLLRCDVKAGDCSHLAKVDGWKWNTANRSKSK